MIFAMKRVSTYRGEIEMKVSKIYTTIDAHVAGEPLRIITGGVPEIKEKRSWKDAPTAWNIWITFVKF